MSENTFDGDSAGTAEITARKAELRAQVRAARRALSSAERASRDALIARHLLSYLQDIGARTVAAYFPLPFEPGGPTLVPALRDAGLNVLLPRVVVSPSSLSDANPSTTQTHPPQTMEFCLFNGALTRGSFGIAEPIGPAYSDFPEGVDAIVIPALNIDYQGARLGQGGGYYDSAVGQLETSAPICAIVDHDEFTHVVPTHTWDLRVDSVVTDKGATQVQGSNRS